MCHAHCSGGDAPTVVKYEVGIEVPGGTMPATLFLPDAGTGPGIELLSDIYGPVPFYQGIAARLANLGYVALLPDYFFRQGALPEQTREAALARHSHSDEQLSLRDHAAAAAWLREHAAVEGARIGLLGFCLGGTYALDLCADGQDAVVACYYPFPYGVDNPAQTKAPRPIDVVTHINAPVLAHWGDADYISLTEIAEFTEDMHAAGKPYTEHIYAGADHGFLTGLVEKREDSEAAQESWSRTMDFFARELGGTRGTTPDGPSRGASN